MDARINKIMILQFMGIMKFCVLELRNLIILSTRYCEKSVTPIGVIWNRTTFTFVQFVSCVYQRYLKFDVT